MSKIVKFAVAFALATVFATFTFNFVSSVLPPLLLYWGLFIYISYEIINAYEKYKSSRGEDKRPQE